MASNYSFDVVSEFDNQELVNAIDQLKREVLQRYDLKDSNSQISLEDGFVLITTASDMTLQAIQDVLRQKAIKRNLSLKIFDFQAPEPSSGNRVSQKVLLRKGINQDLAKKLSAIIRKDLKKINVSIQGESLRVTGKSKDDLQEAIKIFKKEEESLEQALQFENYR